MRDDIKDLPASIHARLKRIAKENKQTFQDVFYQYAWERFLYRLSVSKYKEDFVLKGALMFLGWGLPLRRPTRDIDLQGYTTNSVANLVEIVSQVCKQPSDPDGMIFDPNSLVGEEVICEVQYCGIRVRFKGFLGNAVIWMQIDVSFANVITPDLISFAYPTLLEELGMAPFAFRGYPYETSIAEKVHAIVKLEMINDRLIDFYDIWLISRNFDVCGQILVDAFTSTFRARETALPTEVPVAFKETFVQEKSRNWNRLINKLPPDSKAPTQFYPVISKLQEFLLPPLFAASEKEPFPKNWHPNEGWL